MNKWYFQLKNHASIINYNFYMVLILNMIKPKNLKNFLQKYFVVIYCSYIYPLPSLSRTWNASNTSSSKLQDPNFLDIIIRNSENSIVPFPSKSTSCIISCSSEVVGFSPRDVMTVLNSSHVIDPSPSLSKNEKASLHSAIWSSVKFAVMIFIVYPKKSKINSRDNNLQSRTITFLKHNYHALFIQRECLNSFCYQNTCLYSLTWQM